MPAHRIPSGLGGGFRLSIGASCSRGGIRKNLDVAPDAKYPMGAAVVASRLAFYAAVIGGWESSRRKA